MTEPDQIEFHEHIGGPDGGQPANPMMRSVPARIGIVAGSAILVLVGAVAAMGASPAPSAPAANPGGTTTPPTPLGGSLPRIGPLGGFGFDSRGPGGNFKVGGFGDITISAIDGSNLSLKTDDGWTRTISVGSSTTISKGGQAVAVGDLKVGDQIVFGESRASDGSYTISAIKVVLPVIGGQVTAVGSDSITVNQKGGGSATIHVSATTTYDVDGKSNAKLSDVTVGSFVVAEGTQRSDGSLDASAVHAGTPGGPNGVGRPKFRFGPDDQANPKANPSATPGSSSSAS